MRAIVDQQSTNNTVEHPALRWLEPGETVQVLARASDTSLLVTDRRVAVAEGDRVALDVPIKGLRRIQFDIERERPATLVIVPDHPAHEPRVIAVPPERFDEITRALAFIGSRLHELH